MTADELRKHQRRAPFLPIVIHMANGRSFEIRHPEMMTVADEIAAVTGEEDGHLGIHCLTIMNINEIAVGSPASS